MSDAPNPDEASFQKDERGRFLSGNSGGGRPKGARSKLGEAFLEAMLDDWSTHGAKAIAVCRETKPEVYVKVVASILPKELNVKVSELDELTDEQLDQRIRMLARALDIETGPRAAAGGAEASGRPQPAGDVPAIH